MTSELVDSLTTTDALARVFSDRSLVQAMLDVETALAGAEARAGLIPERAASAIRTAAVADHFDAGAIARAARESGTLAIPLVDALTARVREIDSDSARFVHWGATSQDISDTALVLTIAQARSLLATDHQRLERTLRELSDRHAGSVMLARTLLQPAPPITFGLKVAGWFAALHRSWTRLDAALDEAVILQFGGASGTLAALGDQGNAIGRAMAESLGLRNPVAPWHTHRDRLATLVALSGVYTGMLGKTARDISLLMQDEVREAAEPGGGSSSMPHKRNPAGCGIVLAAATRLPGLVASMLTGMVQEHERGVGGWHAEWPTVTAALQATGAALAAMADVVGSLSVDPDRMRSNIESTNGVIFAERVVMLLAGSTGKETAHRLATEAVRQSRATGRRLREVLAAMPDVRRAISDEQLKTIDDPEHYLGAAETMRVRLLAESADRRPPTAES